MNYSVPQFIDVEDKIIGNTLTLKQFLFLLAGGFMTFIYWTLFKKILVIFFVLAIPTDVFVAIVALYKPNGRALWGYLPYVIHFFTVPRYRVFRRTFDDLPQMIIQQPERKENRLPADPIGIVENKRSRLKKLAYLLDEKSAEEQRIVHSGKRSSQFISEM